MALNIRPQTRQALKPKLVEFFQGARVENGSVLNAEQSIMTLVEAESLLPKSGPVRESLDAFVGEASLVNFVDDRVRTRLMDRAFDPEAAEISLPDALDGADLGAFADEVVDALATLPWDYWASLWLPEKLSALLEVLPPIYPVGPFRFVRDEAELARTAQRPTVGIGGLLGSGLQLAPHRGALQVRVQGFVVRYGETETVHEAHSLFKSFFGLGLALALFKIDDAVSAPNTRLTILFGQINGVEVHRVAQKVLSHAESETIQSIGPNADQKEGSELRLGGEGKLAAMAKIFEESERHASLLRAGRWLYDSHVGDDKLLNFVQAMVVLEIVLGDRASSDEIGLGTLLANRCAYMIGGTTSQRAAILKDFKAIYAVRSQIVHAGKSRLSSSEELQLSRLRWLGRRVIREEIKLALQEIARRRPATAPAAPSTDG